MNRILLLVLLLSGIGIVMYYSIIYDKDQITNSTIPEHNRSDRNKEIGTSTYYGRLDYQSKLLYNNVWGAKDGEISNKNLKSYIYYKSNGNFGWEWNRPNPGTHNPIYPEVIVGAQPDNAYSTTSVFPIKYGDIDSWTSEINFTYTKSQTGRSNLAYDIYWMDGKDKKLNIMIWLRDHHDDKSIGTVSDGFNEYIHYKRGASGDQYWEWHAFEVVDQKKSYYKFDIKKLLDNTFGPGYINDDWTIPGMELGSEVWRGSGRVEISRYLININDNKIEGDKN